MSRDRFLGQLSQAEKERGGLQGLKVRCEGLRKAGGTG